MLLTRITLRDVGIYGGTHTFELATKPQRPIVLYGGANGAGKTTLFESIKLCLYGQASTDNKITKKQYHKKIHRLFHRYSKTHTSAREATIILDFEYSQHGKIDQYRIVRSWQNIDGGIEETLTMQKWLEERSAYLIIDGERNQIQMMINQMIPEAIASMFFFDGEKIQDIVQSGNEDAHIRSSFDTLLGLDIPKKLSDDIGLYLLRKSNSEADTALLAELEQKTQEKQDSEQKLANLCEKRVFLNAEIGRKRKELEQKEQKFFNMGGDFALERQKLVEKKTNLDRNIMHVENLLRELVETDLPLIILHEQLEQVKEEIQSDIVKLKAGFERESLTSAFKNLENSMDSRLESYSSDIRKDVLQKLSEIIKEKLESLPKSQSPVFDFSFAEMRMLQSRIDSISNDKHVQLLGNSEKHRRFLDEHKEVSAKINVAPLQDEAGPLYSEIKDITLEIGEMEQELHQIESMEAQKKSMIILINSKIRSCLARKKTTSAQQRGLDMIPKIQDALRDYSQILRTEKIKLLESNILEGIRKCFHKDRLISRITIDPETYQVTMYMENDDVLTKEQLAAGELQMYATAIVWGLARTSGRALPFVIDTPLARLDEKHRENLIENFYPTASHQTIIFSTNTEIIDSYFEMLKPYLSHTVLIQYDAKKDGSITSDGYFGEGRIVAT